VCAVIECRKVYSVCVCVYLNGVQTLVLSAWLMEQRQACMCVRLCLNGVQVSALCLYLNGVETGALCASLVE
jgi:hypothetical protein